jgi:predicted Fe-Mo cluster-binding NifX family protein
MNMKIAVVTDDEVTINRHFGRAPYYMVYTIEDGKITGKEKRDKAGHHHQVGHEGNHGCHSSGPHGYDAESQDKHASMASAIADCQVLIAGGMGMGAYDSLKSYKIEPVITNALQIEDAVKLFIEGKLPNLKERLH